MSEIDLNILKWDPKILEFKRTHGHAPKILIIGKTGTGKTTLVQDLLFYIRKIQSGVVICPTEQSLVDYRLMFPEVFIHDKWDPPVIENFIKMQKKIRKTDANFHSLLMLDDIMYDKNAILKDESTRFIFMNGRNNNITMIITMQYCMDLPPDLRNNIDFVIALRDNIHANREKLWKNFFGVIPTADAFHQIFQQCTSGFNCIVLDNTNRTARIEDSIFYYSADAREEPAKILRRISDNTFDTVFEDGTEVDAVNTALMSQAGKGKEEPFEEGDDVKIKFKRTWLTLHSLKRRCFMPSMWEFHSDRFNPRYDDDDDGQGNETLSSTALLSSSTSGKKRVREGSESKSNMADGVAAPLQQPSSTDSEFTQKFRKLKRGERANIQIKMI